MSAQRLERIVGRAIPVRGHDIDTDRILPARFLVAVSFEGIEAHVFEDERAVAKGAHPFDQPQFAGARILVVNRNFGCGSSREHAPQAIQRWGIQAVLGESFSEIFFGNSVAIGLPCVTVSPEATSALQAQVEATPDAEVAVDLVAGTVTCGPLSVAGTLPAAARDGFISGDWDATGLLLDDVAQVEATAARLPYVSGW
jgi:3-isopropylmalate/(R)-2-methylmalate dehydratase small subunit